MNRLQVTGKSTCNIFIMTKNVVIIFQLHKSSILPFTVRDFFFKVLIVSLPAVTYSQSSLLDIILIITNFRSYKITTFFSWLYNHHWGVVFYSPLADFSLLAYEVS